MSNDNAEYLQPDPRVLAREIGQDNAQGSESAAAVALAHHHDALMGRAGVVMLGETLDAVGRPAILIGVRTRKDLARLPEQVDGVPVVTQVIGEVDAQ